MSCFSVFNDVSSEERKNETVQLKGGSRFGISREGSQAQHTGLGTGVSNSLFHVTQESELRDKERDSKLVGLL